MCVICTKFNQIINACGILHLTVLERRCWAVRGELIKAFDHATEEKRIEIEKAREGK